MDISCHSLTSSLSENKRRLDSDVADEIDFTMEIYAREKEKTREREREREKTKNVRTLFYAIESCLIKAFFIDDCY